MLNYRDAPNVDIASAICASSAVPGLMDKTALLEKAPDGFLRTFGGDDEASSANGMRDGSFEADMPLQYLAAHFGCSFAIVSMVNPHVVPFWARLTGSPGRPTAGRAKHGGWRGGFTLAVLESLFKELLRMKLGLIVRLKLPAQLAGVDWRWRTDCSRNVVRLRSTTRSVLLAPLAATSGCRMRPSRTTPATSAPSCLTSSYDATTSQCSTISPAKRSWRGRCTPLSEQSGSR